MSIIVTVKCDSCEKIYVDFYHGHNNLHGLLSDLDEGGWDMPNGEHWCSQCRWEAEINNKERK